MISHWCTADVTPGWPVALAGTGPGRVSRHVADPLEANLWMLGTRQSPTVIASIDTLFVGESVEAQVAERTGIPRERLLLIASHSHSAPSLAPEVPALGEPDPAYQAVVVEKLGAAIEGLRRSEGAPVDIRRASCATTLNANRRRPAFVVDYHGFRKSGRLRMGRRIALAENPTGAVDRNIQILLLERRDGGPPLAIWSFAAHPAFFPDRLAISADYPGYIRRHIRRALGEQVSVLYLPGLAGSAVPRIPFSLGRGWRGALLRLLPCYPMLNAFTPRSYRRWCDRLAGAIDQCLDDLVPIAVDETPSVKRSTVRHVMRGHRDVDLNLCSVELGEELRLLLFSGEMIGEWEPLIRPTIGHAAIASSYLAGFPFYVPTEAAQAEGGYEADGFRRYFGISANFAANLNQRLIDALKAMNENR